MAKNRRVLTAYKVFFGLLGLSAIVTEIVVLVARGTFNPVNFFSFFTIQTNALVCITFFLSAIFFQKKRASWLATLRAATTVYILIVGVGFAVLLSGVEGLVLSAVPWDNIVLHYIIPVVVLVDFMIDRPVLTTSFVKNTWWLLFPIAYAAYSLIRGRVSGWYPYPFLNPTIKGYGVVVVSIFGLAILGVLLVWGVSKLSNKPLRNS
ncbi:MAG TPA: Pr6Pr family membrane protein [Candidatus Saccharimonadales bacterium]|nr:Pr6Pr family membrane protein [Candidatus Saccharimonadales bacterium]